MEKGMAFISDSIRPNSLETLVASLINNGNGELKNTKKIMNGKCRKILNSSY